MNKILLDYYNLSFNEEELRRYLDEIDNVIEEVDFNNIESVIKDTLFYISESKNITSEDLEVFDKDTIIGFINELNKIFVEDNKEIIKQMNLKKC